MIIQLLQTSFCYLGSNSVIGKLSMKKFHCNTMLVLALALEPIGVTVNMCVSCNTACIWESLSTCVRKRYKQRQPTNFIIFGNVITLDSILLNKIK